MLRRETVCEAVGRRRLRPETVGRMRGLRGGNGSAGRGQDAARPPKPLSCPMLRKAYYDVCIDWLRTLPVMTLGLSDVCLRRTV